MLITRPVGAIIIMLAEYREGHGSEWQAQPASAVSDLQATLQTFSIAGLRGCGIHLPPKP